MTSGMMVPLVGLLGGAAVVLAGAGRGVLALLLALLGLLAIVVLKHA